MRQPRGFTLIEMMVVVAIIGILSALVFGMSSRPYGANAQQVSEQIVSTLGLARLRANATRKTHRVRVQNHQLSLWVADAPGLVAPTFSSPQPIQVLSLPRDVRVWHAQAGALTSTGASPAETASLIYDIDVRPDGQATASTLFVTDTAQSRKYRVLVYHVTGGSYARQHW